MKSSDLETGATIATLRRRGCAWTELADAFDLVDENEAQRLAAGYMLASGARTAQEGAGATHNRPALTGYRHRRRGA